MLWYNFFYICILATFKMDMSWFTVKDTCKVKDTYTRKGDSNCILRVELVFLILGGWGMGLSFMATKAKKIYGRSYN